jgi:hypothetical protein
MVIAGPTQAGGFMFWRVQFSDGITGWVVEWYIVSSSKSSNANVVVGLTGTGVQPPAGARNAVSFLGTDTTTQGAWKGIGNFNAPPASNSLVYGKNGVILPDTEGCDT